MKRLGTVGLNEPVQKRPANILEDSGVTAEVLNQTQYWDLLQDFPVHATVLEFDGQKIQLEPLLTRSLIN